MNHIVRGLFSDFGDVATIVSRLELAGFSEQQISVISHDEHDLELFKINKNTKFPEGEAIDSDDDDDEDDDLLGTIAGGFAAVGAFATGGIGILAAGPIATSFAAGAADTGTPGGIYGTVFPDNEKQYYQDCVQQGAIMVVAHCAEQSQAEKATQIFNQYDPIKVG